MEQHVKSSNGFTILEVLVALFLFSFILLGTLGIFLKTYDYSLKNELRNQAVKIAQEELEKYRNMDFNSILSESTTCSSSMDKVERQVRNENFVFIVARNITEEVPDSVKKIEITICWNVKGKEYNYTATTLITPF